ncbi:hypothetical protein B0H16DRAFT_1748744 [Mycena metata]|uniref:Uncharacterized protein n=1 Tax=Mycena metata TaxID=1033252 RepID=A0AAD7DWB4_9AGAR|nr:hypothetical protein B0H16DRAFT_1748744 [Mycena metata]
MFLLGTTAVNRPPPPPPPQGLLAVPNKPNLCQFKENVNQNSVDREKEGAKEHSPQLSITPIPWHEYSKLTVYSDVQKLQSAAKDLHGHWIAMDPDGKWGILAAQLMTKAPTEPWSTKIFCLELCKEHKLPKHEFLLLTMADETKFRIDRTTTGALNSVMWTNTPPVDTISLISDPRYQEIRRTSQCLVKFSGLPEDIDLSLIRLICYAIKHDDQGVWYTLDGFNCYFFARCIVVVLARHIVLRNRKPDAAIADEVDTDFQSFVNSQTTDVDGARQHMRGLEQLQHLRQGLKQKLLCLLGRITLNVDLELHKTLFRDDSRLTTSSAIAVAVRQANGDHKLDEWRQQWVSENIKHAAIDKLAAVWCYAWQDVWQVIGKWEDSYRNVVRLEEWGPLWDKGQGELKKLEQVTENVLQDPEEPWLAYGEG